MPYTLKQFKKDLVLDHLDELEPEQVLSKYKPEERLRGMSRRQLEAYLRKLDRKNKARRRNGR